MDDLLGRITTDPDICFGMPSIRDTQISVLAIIEMLAVGMTTEQVIAEYPQLTKDDVLAAVAYVSEMPCDDDEPSAEAGA